MVGLFVGFNLPKIPNNLLGKIFLGNYQCIWEPLGNILYQNPGACYCSSWIPMVGLFVGSNLPKSPNNLGNNFWVITNAFENHWATSYTKSQGLAIAARGSQWWACLLDFIYQKSQ